MSSVEYCRRAIALHNMGISLVERGMFNEGIRALKGALAGWQLVLKEIEGAEGQHDPSSTAPSDIDSVMFRATQKLATSERPTATASTVDVVSYDGFFVRIRSGPLMDYKATDRVAVFIRLDCDFPEDKDPELIAGIMLCNFGVAHLCLSRDKEGESSARQRSHALDLFEIALFYINSVGDIVDDYLRIGFIVLNHMVQAHMINGHVEQANECDRRLRIIQKMGREDIIPTCDNKVAVAA